MLTSQVRSSLLSLLFRYPQFTISNRTCYDARNKITGAYIPFLKRDGPSIVRNGDPPFFTKATFQEQQKLDRTENADTNFGVTPTKWQKRFLVITRMYECQSDIPFYVASGTINRMHDRVRILSTFLAICGFFSLFYYCHYLNVKRVMRDREAGVRV